MKLVIGDRLRRRQPKTEADISCRFTEHVLGMVYRWFLQLISSLLDGKARGREYLSCMAESGDVFQVICQVESGSLELEEGQRGFWGRCGRHTGAITW